MATYNVASSKVMVSGAEADLLKIGFGDPAQNDQIVQDAAAALEALELQGGALVLLNGPASLPVACVLSHALAHRYAGIGVFDPKMAGYVVSIAHGSSFRVGQVIPAASVVAA